MQALARLLASRNLFTKLNTSSLGSFCAFQDGSFLCSALISSSPAYLISGTGTHSLGSSFGTPRIQLHRTYPIFFTNFGVLSFSALRPKAALCFLSSFFSFVVIFLCSFSNLPSLAASISLCLPNALSSAAFFAFAAASFASSNAVLGAAKLAPNKLPRPPSVSSFLTSSGSFSSSPPPSIPGTPPTSTSSSLPPSQSLGVSGSSYRPPKKSLGTNTPQTLPSWCLSPHSSHLVFSRTRPKLK
mmetsp:Transcript_10872/g.22048  ORF Transcript_10872/g.22048 Transcript_10872/m.22048 type:complete len:243 (-) Transcript_10872:194-922(-)